MLRQIPIVSLLGVMLLPGAAGAHMSHSLRTPRVDRAPAAAAYRLCQASSLRGLVELQGAAGQRGGQATLTNRGTQVCVVQGIPRTTIVRRNGRALRVRQLPGNSAPNGVPVSAVELVPGQQTIAMIQWSNYCGPNPGKTHLVMRLPGGGALPVPAVGFSGPTIPVPPCLGPGQPSTLSVGAFLPPTEDPATAVLNYYGNVNMHMLHLAYGMLGGRKPAFRTFATGYRDTAHVTVNLVATPLYRIYRRAAAYTCVGVHFTALSSRGRRTGFGGWYLIATRYGPSFTLIPARSSIHPNQPLDFPTRSACAARVP
ncbi:MAG: DUF4232 domain-containing protein [Chloroflexota bacterium]|nr:DUF4232 domain-containing protein [Chloroflexota bacterium]